MTTDQSKKLDLKTNFYILKKVSLTSFLALKKDILFKATPDYSIYSDIYDVCKIARFK